jgi:hypothetical protein
MKLYKHSYVSGHLYLYLLPPVCLLQETVSQVR